MIRRIGYIVILACCVLGCADRGSSRMVWSRGGRFADGSQTYVLYSKDGDVWYRAEVTRDVWAEARRGQEYEGDWKLDRPEFYGP